MPGRRDAGAPEAADIRPATPEDVPAIVDLLADDPLGRQREDASRPIARAYRDAFAAIEADPNQILAVAVLDGSVIGTMQVTFLPGLSHRGAWRGQIESVRVAGPLRGAGLGARMVAWAVERCRERGCTLVQLATHRSRSDAHRFYERLGFEASHVGYKLTL